MMKKKCSYFVVFLAFCISLVSCEQFIDEDSDGKTKVQSVSLGIEGSSLSIIRTRSVQLDVTIQPEIEELQGYEWINSDPTIVSISETGLVTALKEGSAIIGVKTMVGGKRALVSVTVTKYVAEVPIKSMTLNKANYNFTSITDAPIQLLVKDYVPANPTLKEVVWSSSNLSVARVTPDGFVSIVGGGSSVIRATAIDGGDAFVECPITVPGTAIKDLNYDSIGTIYNSGYYKIFYEPIEIEVTDFITGKKEKQIWLDRNLGARRRATGYDDYLSFGSLFQWSRKADGHEQVNWTLEGDPQKINASLTPVQTTQATNRTHVGHSDFINKNDWAIDGSSSVKGLWGGTQFAITSNLSSKYITRDQVATMDSHASLDDATQANNPCPYGYRVPTLYEWHLMIASVASMDEIIINGSNAVKNPTTLFSGSPIYIPFAGYRSYNNSLLSNTLIWFMIWTNSNAPHSTGVAWQFRVNNQGSVLATQQARAHACPIRCIKD